MRRPPLLICIASACLLLFGVLNCSKPTPDTQTSEAEIKSHSRSTSYIGKPVDNRSNILAKVLEIVALDSARFYLRLQILKANTVSGFESFAKAGQEINAYPNFRRSEGQAIHISSEHNQSMLLTRNLQPGDRIMGEVYYRGGSGTESTWLLMSWKSQ